AISAVEDGNRNSPDALTGDAPVRPALEHVRHPQTAPPRHPVYAVDFFDCRLPQRAIAFRGAVHRYKPLRCRTKDNRAMATPTVWVTVRVVFAINQSTDSFQEIDNPAVCFEHLLTREPFYIPRKAPGVIYRTVNFGALLLTTNRARFSQFLINRREVVAVLLADHEVIVSVAWRSMYTARARFTRTLLLCVRYVQFSLGVRLAAKSHVLADHHQRIAIDPRVTRPQSIEQGSGKGCYEICAVQNALSGHRIYEVSRYDVDFAAHVYGRVIEVRVYRDPQVCRQRPGSCRPNQNKHRLACCRDRGVAGSRFELANLIVRKWELDVDRRAGVLPIFDFRFCQRSLVVNTPVDRTRTLVNKSTLDETPKQTGGLRFVSV